MHFFLMETDYQPYQIIVILKRQRIVLTLLVPGLSPFLDRGAPRYPHRGPGP